MITAQGINTTTQPCARVYGGCSIANPAVRCRVHPPSITILVARWSACECRAPGRVLCPNMNLRNSVHTRFDSVVLQPGGYRHSLTR